MNMAAQLLKSLSIKTNIVRRITKELQVYREEERAEKEKVRQLKESGGDPYDIKFAVRGPEYIECLPWISRD